MLADTGYPRVDEYSEADSVPALIHDNDDARNRAVAHQRFVVEQTFLEVEVEALIDGIIWVHPLGRAEEALPPAIDQFSCDCQCSTPKIGYYVHILIGDDGKVAVGSGLAYHTML